jgi:uncharacterized membrane protein YfcA
MPDSGVFVGGCITLFFSCVVCAAGGVGGGGIVVPILLIIYGYSYQSCVNYSLFTLLGSYFAQLTINLFRFHPTKKFHPLIAWEVVTVLLPAQLGGSNIGSILGAVFPDSVRYLFALLFLCYACYLTYTKGVHRWEDETKEMEEKRKLEEAKGSEIEAPRNSIIEEIGSTVSESDIKRMILPKKNIIAILVMWFSYIAIVVGMNFTKKCSAAFDASMVILYIPLLITVVWGVGVLRGREQQTSATKALAPNESVENPISTQNNATTTAASTANTEEAPPGDTIATKDILPFPVIVFVIGIICSLLGIGGGELLSPLLLSYHMIPQIVSATSATMSFLNTLANVIRLMSAHSGTIDVGFIFTIVGFFGGIVGRHLGLYIATHNGRASVIIFALTVVLFFSCIYYLVVLATDEFDSGMKVYC